MYLERAWSRKRHQRCAGMDRGMDQETILGKRQNGARFSNCKPGGAPAVWVTSSVQYTGSHVTLYTVFL